MYTYSILCLIDVFVLFSSRLSKSVVSPLMEPLLRILIEKLSDGTARIRDTARTSIEAMAACPVIGPAAVAAHGIAAVQKSTWRPILGRLQLLTDLVTAYGIGGKGGPDSTGLTVDAVMTFTKNAGAFSHSNSEVRDGAKGLVVAVQKHTGTDVLLPYLKDLRPKQLEEYMNGFVDYKESPGAASKPAIAAANPSESKDSRKNPKASVEAQDKSGRDKHHNHLTKADGGKVQTSAAKAEAKEGKSPHQPSQHHSSSVPSPGGQDHGGDDFTKCMFCGKSETNWTEDLLDLHYWKECPLLSPCPACAQIVEIAGLPEHLLDECEHKQNFVSCETTGA
jgi:centrosomal protein CEP104